VDFPGSISLSRDTFTALVREVLAGVQRSGAAGIVLLNTGISTIESLEYLVQSMAAAWSVGLIHVYSGPRFERVQSQVEHQPCGGHADESETSLLLAIAPEQGDMTRAEPAPGKIEHGPLNRYDPAAPNYAPAGTTGDPRLATLEKGRRLLAAQVEDVLDTLDAFLGTLAGPH